MTVTKRRPDAEARRRDLCDAAIELLAEDGARGVTHLRVDRRAGVADGTTSFYYQTRSALLRGATDRVVQLDVADFTAAMYQSQGNRRRQGRIAVVPVGRAGHAHRRGTGTVARAGEIRTDDGGARDPELGSVFQDLMDQFVAISEAAVAQLQPRRGAAAPKLIKDQAFAVVTFLGGFLFRLAYGLAGSKNARSWRLTYAPSSPGWRPNTPGEQAWLTFPRHAAGRPSRGRRLASRTGSNASASRPSPNVGPTTGRVDGTA